MSVPSPLVVRFLRLQAGWDQETLGQHLGVKNYPQVQVSRIEQGKGRLQPEQWERVESVLALGHRTRGEKHPSYLLASLTERPLIGPEATYLRDEFRRIARFREVVWAQSIADALAHYAVIENPGAVPVWRSFIDELTIKEPPHFDWEHVPVYCIDQAGYTEREIALRVQEYLASVARGLATKKERAKALEGLT